MKFCKYLNCRNITIRTLTHLFLVSSLWNEALRGYGRSTSTINRLENISIGVYIFAQQRTSACPMTHSTIKN
jgi:hypothetical protein